jgi:hypothetical protein
MAKEYQLEPRDFLNLERYECLLKTVRGVYHILTFPPPEVEAYRPVETFIHKEVRSKDEQERYSFLRECWFSC